LQLFFFKVKHFAMPLLPFVLDHFKNIFVKKLFEILSGHANVHLVVHLNGNAHTVAFSDAKASGQHHLVFKTVLFKRLLKQLDDVLGAL
jgi:hypothetical protein